MSSFSHLLQSYDGCMSINHAIGIPLDVDRHETCRYDATIWIDVAKNGLVKNGLVGQAVYVGRGWPRLIPCGF